MTPSFEEIVAQTVRWNLSDEDVATFCEAEGLRREDLWNRVAVTIAKRFAAGTMSFDDADAAMNAIDAEMIEDALQVGNGYVYPEPAFSIYEAFDAGEFDRGDGVDPVENYTRPRLAEILRDL